MGYKTTQYKPCAKRQLHDSESQPGAPAWQPRLHSPMLAWTTDHPILHHHTNTAFEVGSCGITFELRFQFAEQVPLLGPAPVPTKIGNFHQTV